MIIVILSILLFIIIIYLYMKHINISSILLQYKPTGKYDPDWENRKKFTKSYSWSYPTKSMITAMTKFIDGDKVISIGAGSGYIEHLLSDHGVTMVIGTDNMKRKYKKYHHPIEKLNAIDAIKKYNDHNTLLLSWPEYDDSMASNALKLFTGDKLIYIGEEYGGCTGDDEFHEMLEESWKLIKNIEIPNYYGIHDSVYLYVRK